jgi:cell division protein FtsI (penicillin-binding protein 3)
MAMTLLIGRAVHLQQYERQFLQREGIARYQRVISTPAHRGMILDRNGEVLAISTPVDSVWANPRELTHSAEQLNAVAQLLGFDRARLSQRLAAHSDKEFVYLKRHIDPDLASQILDVGAAGINLQREYRRYYPMGEVNAQVLGFTDIDGIGQEGVERAFNPWLSGKAGDKLVIRDRLNRIIRELENLKIPKPGKDLNLSLDQRVQYLAYRELKAAIQKHGAHSGSIVVLDPQTGEVLAMVNQPSFNPNNRLSFHPRMMRNRAVTDTYEPGSTIKPFVVAAAIAKGSFSADSLVNTSPGWYMVRGHTIQDEHDYGRINLSNILVKSSNVGAAKVALSIPPEQIWDVFHRVGLGETTGSGFPGEAAGVLTHYTRWRTLDRAIMAFGYGLSVTPLQLAQAYAVLATDGLRPTLRFTVADQPPLKRRVLDADTSRQIRLMLEGVVSSEGTARLASVSGFRIAGKTGTVHKSDLGGYAKDRYVSVFAGMAPASKPRLVAVVIINEPSDGKYYGGTVAAPVFSRVMQGALRLLDITPDNVPTLQAQTRDPADSA